MTEFWRTKCYPLVIRAVMNEVFRDTEKQGHVHFRKIVNKRKSLRLSSDRLDYYKIK
jgi:hypothetical protein